MFVRITCASAPPDIHAPPSELRSLTRGPPITGFESSCVVKFIVILPVIGEDQHWGHIHFLRNRVLYSQAYIIQSVDSISRDERGFPLTQYITNGQISRARYTITHFKHHHHVLRLISNRMKSTKVQTLGGIWWKYWNIWIENTFACIRIIVLGIYRTSFQHNLHCFINACVHVVND